MLFITTVYVVYSFFRGYTDYNLSSVLTPLILLPFALIHGGIYCGTKKIISFFILVFVVSVFYEGVSVSTGFPFGNYYYSERLGVKLFDVPLVIMPTYFYLGYVSWFISNVLSQQIFKETESKFKVFIISIVASFIMTSWDLIMEPVNSLVRSLWFWEDNGVYFGVPLTNFFGWFLCVFTFYLPFTFWCYKDKVHFKIKPSYGYLYLPSIIYITIMAKYILCFFFKENVIVTLQNGRMFSTNEIYGTVVLIGFFTMLPIGVHSLYKIYTYSCPNELMTKKT